MILKYMALLGSLLAIANPLSCTMKRSNLLVSMEFVYVHLLVDDVAHFLQTYSSTDFAGFSCTIPHKEAAVKCCDEVDPVARSIGGAVNCIIRRQNDGKIFACNTDYVGAITAIEDGLRASGNNRSAGSPLAGKLFLVIVAGKALAYGAKEKRSNSRHCQSYIWAS